MLVSHVDLNAEEHLLLLLPAHAAFWGRAGRHDSPLFFVDA